MLVHGQEPGSKPGLALAGDDMQADRVCFGCRVSPAQLSRHQRQASGLSGRETVNVIANALANSGLPTVRLELEITFRHALSVARAR